MIITLTLAPDEVVTDVADKARAFAEALGVPMDYVDVQQPIFNGQYVERLRLLSPPAADRWVRVTNLADNTPE